MRHAQVIRAPVTAVPSADGMSSTACRNCPVSTLLSPSRCGGSPSGSGRPLSSHGARSGSAPSSYRPGYGMPAISDWCTVRPRGWNEMRERSGPAVMFDSVVPRTVRAVIFPLGP